MDFVAIYEYLRDHWKDIVEVISYFVAGASVIVKLTPTLKDDNVFLPLIKFLGRYIALDKYGPTKR